MAGYQLDPFGVVLVQGRVVEDQQAPLAMDQGPGLAPERGGVGLQPVKEPGEGVVGRGIGRFGLHRGGLRAAERLVGSDEEIDGIGVVTFRLGGVHGTHHRRPSHSARHGRPTTNA